MKKLDKEKALLGYVSAPDTSKLGLEFVQINITLNNPGAKNGIIRHFDSTGKCLFAMDMMGKFDLAVELHVRGREELNSIMDRFREKFSWQYSDYDISTIKKEHVVVWGPFA